MFVNLLCPVPYKDASFTFPPSLGHVLSVIMSLSALPSGPTAVKYQDGETSLVKSETF